MWLSLLTAAGLLATVTVEGRSSCPHPTSVAERLRGLLSEGTLADQHLVSEVDTRAEGLLVRLRDADGETVGQRLLGGQHPCDQLADAAAVMIATWVEAGHAPGLEPTRAPGAGPIGLGARPSPAGSAPGWDLGAAAGASWSAAGLVRAVAVGAGVDLLGSRYGLRFDGVVTGHDETPLGDRAARWRRSWLSLAARVRGGGHWITGELHAGPALALLQVEGRGFSAAETRSERDAVFGLSSGVRLTLSGSGLRPFLATGVSFWPVRSMVYALPAQIAEPLPRTQLVLTLGVSHRH